jgi:uncharacterized protein DUF3106
MRLLRLVAALLILAGGVSAQRPGKRVGPPPANGLIERLNSMSPEQRKRALDRLPPERRERVQRRLDNYNALSPEAKERLREEYQQFQKLPVERQDSIRRSFRQLVALPQDRKPVVRREVVRLRQLTPEDRASKMDSDDFRSRFSESERQIIRDLANSEAQGRDGPR